RGPRRRRSTGAGAGTPLRRRHTARPRRADRDPPPAGSLGGVREAQTANPRLYGPAASSPGEIRRALLEEGVDAFALVFRAEEQMEARAFKLQAAAERGFECLQDGF